MVPPDPPGVRPDQLLAKRVFITKVDLRDHGWTRGCPRCEADMSGEKTTKGHTEGCRKRTEEALGKTEQGQKRLRDADERAHEAIAKRVQRDAETPQVAAEGAGSPAAAADRVSSISIPMELEQPTAERVWAARPSSRNSANGIRRYWEEESFGNGRVTFPRNLCNALVATLTPSNYQGRAPALPTGWG